MSWRVFSPGPRPARDAPSRGLMSRDGANPESRAQGEATDHAPKVGIDAEKSRRAARWSHVRGVDVVAAASRPRDHVARRPCYISKSPYRRMKCSPREGDEDCALMKQNNGGIFVRLPWRGGKARVARWGVRQRKANPQKPSTMPTLLSGVCLLLSVIWMPLL